MPESAPSGSRAGEPQAIGIGLCARLIVAVTMAGGLVGGGGVVAAIGALRPQSTHLLLGVVPPLFALGAFAGFIHGAILAWLGRPQRCTGSAYRRQLQQGALWSIPGLAVSALIAFWTAYTSTLAGAGRPLWLMAVILGWITGAAVCVWASIEAWRSLVNVVARWPEHRLGIALLSVTLVVAFLLLANLEVEYRGLLVQLNPLVAAPVALALTMWLAAPVEVLLLHAVHRRLQHSAEISRVVSDRPS